MLVILLGLTLLADATGAADTKATSASGCAQRLGTRAAQGEWAPRIQLTAAR